MNVIDDINLRFLPADRTKKFIQLCRDMVSHLLQLESRFHSIISEHLHSIQRVIVQILVDQG